MVADHLTHVGGDGSARMVDVSEKGNTARSARAEAVVVVGEEVGRILRERGSVRKGNVIETARIAGIQAAKKTASLIPLCHPIPLDLVDLEAELSGDRVRIVCEVRCVGKTGVEMEAMTGASVAALTVYDMCKSAGKGILVETVRLLEKRGGKSGHWRRDSEGEGR